MNKKLITILLMLVLVISLGVIVTACDKEDVDSVYKPTNIKYDGTKISWSKVKLADYYTVSINGGEEKRTNTSTFGYDATEQQFDVVVKAYIGKKSFSAEQTFIPLATIQDLTISNDGVISWNEIEGASGYKVLVNGQEKDVTDSHFAGIEGSNRIKVRAIVSGDNRYFSKWSDEKVLFVNSSPRNIAYDGSVLTWVGSASTYEVAINGSSQVVEGTQLLYNSGNIDFEVSIKALGNHVDTYDSKAIKENFGYLEPVQNIVMSNGVLTWSEVAKAEAYKIKINGVEVGKPVTIAEYANLASGKQLQVEIMPINNSGKYFSTWSVAKNIYILPCPVFSWNADLELDGEANNNYIWDAVNGASGYVVEVSFDGKSTMFELGKDARAFAYAYDKVGEYKVRIKAIAMSGTDQYDSHYSEYITVTRLAAPTRSSKFIESNDADISKGFTVNYNMVSGASGYQLYKEGVLLDGKYTSKASITDDNVVDSSEASSQTINYTVRSMGDIKTNMGKTYVTLPCLSKDALSFRIVVQAMPTNLTMAGFDAKWSAVAGNNGYYVNYGAECNYSSSTSYNLETLQAGNYEIRVCTKGNGAEVLASNMTAPITVTRLEAPSNIKMSRDADGTLEWDSDPNVKPLSYSVYLDQSATPLEVKSFDNMNQFIKESGTVLHMIANYNAFNSLGTVYYMTSRASKTVQFVRLAAPTFSEAAFAGQTELVWNTPANINTIEYTPRYEVTMQKTTQSGLQNSNKFNIEHLDAGSYTFSIKAVGNGSKYVDSKSSIDISIDKLPAPQIKIVDDKYKWDSITATVDANAYVLEIDGVRVSNDIHVSGTTYSYVPNYKTAGGHIVKLWAVGDGVKTINSRPYVLDQEVKACVEPEFKFSYSNPDGFVRGGTINVEITKPSANTKGYLYNVAGTSATSSETKFSKVITDIGEFYVSVKALGGKFDETNIYYIESQVAGGNDSTKVVLLGYPSNNSFSMTSSGAIRWATVNKALGYDYQISFDGGEYSQISHRTSAAIDPIVNFKEYRTIKIRVRASGNAQNIINSTWVEWTWTNPNK